MADPVGEVRAVRASESPVRVAITAVLLLATFVGLLWVPSYAHVTPALGGIPFFYWYSVLWLIINALCQVVAYKLIVRRARGRRGEAA